MPPSPVTYFQLRLNLCTADDKEIYDHLQKIPGRQRSTTVKVALLAYFRGRGAGTQERRPRPKLKPHDRPPAAQFAQEEQITEKPSPQAATPASTIETGLTQETTRTSEVEEKEKGLLGLLQ